MTLTIFALAVRVKFEVLLRLFGFQTLRSKLRATAMRRSQSSVQHICDAVNRACSIYLGDTHCLMRSVVTRELLRFHGIPAVMVMGVSVRPVRGHTWVEVGGCVVNDAFSSLQNYVVIDRI
jgi:hypothetical protein